MKEISLKEDMENIQALTDISQENMNEFPDMSQEYTHKFPDMLRENTKISSNMSQEIMHQLPDKSKENMRALPDYVCKTIDILKNANYEAYLVGGCVRDLLMGTLPNDYDITTNALPDEIKEVFKEYRTIDVGIQYGTVCVVVDGHNIEITTYRIDGRYRDNRHPDKVIFTANITDDLSRRDFTINAIAYDGENIIDPFNGKKDIENRIIRCVGDAYERFDEDALRIMRALRFSSALKFNIEKNTEEICFELADSLKNISAERLHTELNKLLLGDDVYKVLSEYHPILSVFIPEIKPCIAFDQKTVYHIYDVWRHISKAVASSPKSLRIRLTMLFHDLAKPLVYTTDEMGSRHFFGHAEESSKIANVIMKRLCYDKKTIKNVTLLVKYHDHNNRNVNDPRVIKRFLSIIGEENYFLLLDVKLADTSAKSSLAYYVREKCELAALEVSRILTNGDPYLISHLEVNGYDLTQLGFKGEKIRQMLNFILTSVIEEDISNDRDKLLTYAKKMLDKGF
ncbi:polynucleotide adenylyltransferase [Clostridia bacterium]|nr:polynucleotide adenylyltransferase [Clostridia bacterium]